MAGIRGVGRALLGAALAGICVFAGGDAWSQDAAYWQKYEAMLTSKGLMRTERDPADAPYSNADLVRDFHAIMLHKEHARRGGDFVKNAARRPLKKLEPEVGIAISGRTIDAADMANIRGVMDRLHRVTGVRLVESGADPTIRLMILTREERLAFARKAAEDPRWSFIAQNVANDLGRAVCGTYYSRDRKQPGRYDYIVVIPAEVGGLLRQSCLEEELGQAFGPGADYDKARPSIFNDDAEFALMTRHDEELLRILYDPRLKAGMTAAQAMPIVHRIVEELRPGR